MIVAEGIGGSQEEFAKMMNKKSKEIGAKNTNFVLLTDLTLTIIIPRHMIWH